MYYSVSLLLLHQDGSIYMLYMLLYLIVLQATACLNVAIRQVLLVWPSDGSVSLYVLLVTKAHWVCYIMPVLQRYCAS